jgi:hypothetical protein
MTQTTYKSGFYCGQTELKREDVSAESNLTDNNIERFTTNSTIILQGVPITSPQYSSGIGMFCQPTRRSPRGLYVAGDRFTDFFRDRRKGIESEIIRGLERRIDELESEVAFLKTRDTSPIKVRVVEIQDKPLDEIYDIVLNYYNTHDVSYPDEVADTLNLDLRKVIEVVTRLIEEGKIEVAT